MQLQRIELKKLGTTERILRSDTQGNFDKLENAVNSNAGATEAGHKQLGADLSDEAQARKMGDDSEARDRRAADEELEQRITKLEKIIFGQDPLEIKDTVPTKAESTAVEINDSLATQIFLE